MTSITKIGGVVVVTQVIPQEDASIPLQTSAASAAQLPQAPRPATQAPPTAPPKMDKMTATFLRGQPQGLGVVQIIIGLLCVLFSLTAVFSEMLIVHAPFCLAVSFVVSGSVTVAAMRRTSLRLVWTSLVWNLISTVVGLVGVAYDCWLLADRPPSERFCDVETVGGVDLTDEERARCVSRLWMLDVSLYGPLGLLLVLLVLQVCVTVTVCVFSGKAIRRHSSYAPLTEQVDDDRPLICAASPAHTGNAALLDSNGEDTSRSPPQSA